MYVLFAVSLAGALEPDLDGDGWTQDVDCDDLDPSVNPDAVETCNEIDDDCDALVDDDDRAVTGQTSYLRDADGDGIGVGRRLVSCIAPSGPYMEAGPEVRLRDCDDTDPTVGSWSYAWGDHDGDGYGTIYDLISICVTVPTGYVTNSSDCDDSNASLSPGTPEVCNGIDDDCDGLVDDRDPVVSGPAFYEDTDGDGYGDDAAVDTSSCAASPGYVAVGGDCDPASPTTHPGAPESCDSIDNDCDGSVDEDAVAVKWFVDADGDGYGDHADTVSACAQPSGYVRVARDCDDSAATAWPGAEEVCGNGADDDCDGAVDNCSVSSADVVDFTFQSSVSSSFGGAFDVGDVDADGISDLAVGAPGWGYGTAFVQLGPQTGTVNAADATATFTSSWYGGSVAAAVSLGDANGDGYDDLVVGAPNRVNGSAVFLFLGPVTADADTADADTTFVPEKPIFVQGGWSVDVIPDFDDDGIADIAVGTPGSVLSNGGVWVVPGTLTGTVDSDDATYRMRGPGGTGKSLASLDDNGDGISDLLVGSPRIGAAYVLDSGVRGAAPISHRVTATFSGDGVLSEHFGDQVASGDLDADGYDDAIVAAPAAETSDRESAGAVYAFLGPLSGTVSASDADMRWEGHVAGGLGTSIATGEDVDGDGENDTLIGAPSGSTTYLQLGTPDRGVIRADDLVSWVSPEPDGLGWRVGFVPDWTGDGLPEIATTAPGALDASGVAGGAVSVIFSDSLYE